MEKEDLKVIMSGRRMASSMLEQVVEQSKGDANIFGIGLAVLKASSINTLATYIMNCTKPECIGKENVMTLEDSLNEVVELITEELEIVATAKQQFIKLKDTNEPTN